MRAVQITRFGGPEVLEIVDVPEPTPAPGQQLYDVSTAGLNFADTHHRLLANWPDRRPVVGLRLQGLGGVGDGRVLAVRSAAGNGPGHVPIPLAWRAPFM
jgi:NADPH:quinone reductase-like Zn-dependent oxidoreductase